MAQNQENQHETEVDMGPRTTEIPLEFNLALDQQRLTSPSVSQKLYSVEYLEMCE